MDHSVSCGCTTIEGAGPPRGAAPAAPEVRGPGGGRAVSADAGRGGHHQRSRKPGPPTPAGPRRRATPSRARGNDAPKLRAVPPVVGQFPDLVTADLTAR